MQDFLGTKKKEVTLVKREARHLHKTTTAAAAQELATVFWLRCLHLYSQRMQINRGTAEDERRSQQTELLL